MSASEAITMSRACEVIEIPSGIRGTLSEGTVVRMMQSLGSGYTVATDRGYMCRVDAKERRCPRALQRDDGTSSYSPGGDLQQSDGLGSIEERVRPGDSGQYR